ncbi:MAG: hypothetical protein ACLQVY_02040 [Limisphaerales bacterium]
MRAKALLLAIVSFWLVMNYLLWRSQWGPHSRIGNSVPVEVVWDKILTAPDSSALDVYDHEKKIGVCHWLADVGGLSGGASRNLSPDFSPEGMVEEVTGYSLTFEGNVLLPQSNHLRFESSMNLTTNRSWKDLHARVSLRPAVWDVRAGAASGKLTLKVDTGGGTWQKTIRLDDLRHPETLLEDLGPGYALGLLAGSGLPLSQDSVSRAAAGMHWQAHEDWMRFGHTEARVYRVETDFLGQHIYLFISRVGEVLWAEFPNKLTFRNEAFEHF